MATEKIILANKFSSNKILPFITRETLLERRKRELPDLHHADYKLSLLMQDYREPMSFLDTWTRNFILLASTGIMLGIGEYLLKILGVL